MAKIRSFGFLPNNKDSVVSGNMGGERNLDNGYVQKSNHCTSIILGMLDHEAYLYGIPFICCNDYSSMSSKAPNKTSYASII
jgi:hypothetical protein